MLTSHQLELAGAVGVAQRDLHREAVELHLGKRVRALEIERVLRGDHHERTRHLTADAVVRDLSFLHHLEQCRLRFR
jgi:hypothetical protein